MPSASPGSSGPRGVSSVRPASCGAVCRTTGVLRSCRTSPHRNATAPGRDADRALCAHCGRLSGADPEAGETGGMNPGLLEHLGDGLALVAGVLLLEQHVLLEEPGHPPFDDLR